MVVTNRVFDSSLDLRQTLFDDPFNNRLKEIITSDLSEIQENAQKLLLKSIEETLGEKSIDFSITSSIWQTGQEDQDGEKDWAKKNLSLRAKSYHPSIVYGISQASARFNKLLPDVKAYTNDKSLLRDESARFATEFCDFCQNLHQKTEDKMKSAERSLIIGRACYALAELCPELQSAAAEKWPQAKEKLVSQGDQAVKTWIDTLAELVGEFYREHFPTKPDDPQLLPLLPALASQTVTEENESGEELESQINVPQAISVALSNALSRQSKQLNKSGGHALKKSQLRHHVKVINIVQNRA